jgi:hypothetical protein
MIRIFSCVFSIEIGFLILVLPLFAEAQKVNVQPLTEEQLAKVYDYLKPLPKELIPVEKQAFYIQSEEKALKNVYFLPVVGNYSGTAPKDRNSRGHISFLLIGERSGKIQELPKHPANDYFIEDVEAVAFRDFNQDGKTDIFTNVSAITGIGPVGAQPFDNFAAYIQNQGGDFELIQELQAKLDQEYIDCVKESCRTLAHMMQLTRNFFKKD